jgi:hypothetical protein
LPVVLYGHKTWPPTLREELWLSVENRVLRKVYGLQVEEVTGGIMRSFMTCTPHQILLGQVNHG